MKYTCEYCGSYVEPDKADNCPNCGANMSGSVKNAIEKERKEKEAKQAAEEERRRQKEENEEVLDVVKQVVQTVVASSGYKQGFRRVKNNVVRYFKRILALLVFAFIIYLCYKFGLLENLLDR